MCKPDTYHFIFVNIFNMHVVFQSETEGGLSK